MEKNMNDTFEILVESFLRTCTGVFTVKDAQKAFSSVGLKCTEKDCEHILSSNPLVFSLKNKEYVTRAGVFTNELFSIKPTPMEYEKGVVLVGSRCMPFVDSNLIASALDFYIDGRKIPKKTESFSSDFAVDVFQFYGQEYASQYIASDPANAKLHLEENGFLLPKNVYMTGMSMAFLQREFGFRKGDRLLCCVNDWVEGSVNVMILHEHEFLFKENEITRKRQKWYELLEKYLLESFDTSGPCSSIEGQLANVFCRHLGDLCVSYCGSLEEFFQNYAKKISFESFGVETRIWRKGEDIPAAGMWNYVDVKEDAAAKAKRLAPLVYQCPPFVQDLYLKDMLYRRKEDLKEVVDLIFPCRYKQSKAEEEELLLNLKSRINIIKKDYNWFKDQVAGPARRMALELFTEVNYLILQVDKLGNFVIELPQHELIVLTQLFSHLLKMIEAFALDLCDEAVLKGQMDSLEGMKWNFEEIEGVLHDSIKNLQLKNFEVF